MDVILFIKKYITEYNPTLYLPIEQNSLALDNIYPQFIVEFHFTNVNDALILF